MVAAQRVRVTVGPHAGRVGTIVDVSDKFRSFLGLKGGQVRVALDGEPGQVSVNGESGRGGAGGVSCNLDVSDLDYL